MTDALVEFLRARLDEDERTACIISCGGFAPEVWRAEPVRSGRWMQIIPYERETNEPPEAEYRASDSPTVLVANNRAEWAHIERWDPARVVAETDAKRRILDQHRRLHSMSGPRCSTCAIESWPCPTLRLLTPPYADHPDYQPEWAPDA